MHKKFIGLKKVIIPALTVVAILAQSSMAFAGTMPTNTLDLINNAEAIVLEVNDLDAITGASPSSTMQSLVGVNTQTKALTDINKHWGKNYINKLVNDGGIKGYPDGTFKPDNTVSAAELTSMLLSSAKYETKELKENWADNMIANGYESGIYTSSNIKAENANAPVSREVVAEVLVNTSDKLLKESTASIDTSDGASYVPDLTSANKTYQPSIVKSYKLGLTGGDTNHRYNPKSSLTRAELSVIVCRLTGLENKVTPVKVEAPETGIFKTVTDAESKKYNVTDDAKIAYMSVADFKACGYKYGFELDGNINFSMGTVFGKTPGTLGLYDANGEALGAADVAGFDETGTTYYMDKSFVNKIAKLKFTIGAGQYVVVQGNPFI